ncbi:MAG: hypothetical protein WBJ41_14315 [Chromatiaceae bacterium]
MPKFEQDQARQDRRLALLLAVFDALFPALFDVAVDEGLHERISAGALLP